MRSDRQPASNDQSDARAVIYLRVSTPRQTHTGADVDPDGNSIATQRVEAIRKLHELGATFEHEFVEPGRSAQTIAKRPQFQQLLRYIDTHPGVTHVIIYMRSRIFRNFTDAAITKRQLLERGVRLVSAKEEFGDGYMADAMEAITDIMNEVQVRMNGQDVAAKMLHKVEQGGTVGRAKLGYLNVRRDFDGRLANTIDVDPVRAPIVTWAFEQYATGEHSTGDIAEMLDAQGLTTRPSPSHSAHTLSRAAASRMLRDPYYRGVIIYKGQQHPGRHQPLVSAELFDEVQRVFTTRREEGSRDVSHRHYLRGRVNCGECRQAGRPGRMVYSRNRGRGGAYEYLICVAHQRRQCPMPNMRLDVVETLLGKLVVAERLPRASKVTYWTRASELLWKEAPGPTRRELLTTLFQDITIYSTDLSSSVK